MEGSPPDARGSEVSRPDARPTGKGRWLVVVLAGWAVVATGLLAWTVTLPRGPTAAEVWQADASQLMLMGYYFESASHNTAGYVDTHNDSLWENATNWIVAAINVGVIGERYGPGGFPSARALNLTWTRLQDCAYTGFVKVHVYNDVSVWDRADYRDYFAQTAGIYGNLSQAIRGPYASGVDPLTALGPAGVAFVETQASLLYALNQPVVGGQACQGP